MTQYHKINTIFKRDMSSRNHPLIEGEWAAPEFEYLKDSKWVGTEKIDGTNTRIIYSSVIRNDMGIQHYIEYRGKTDAAQMFPGMQERLQQLFTVDKLSSYFQVPKDEFGITVTFYGETYGPGIQSGGGYSDAVDFILFDIKIGDWWLNRKDVENISKHLNVPIVPIVFTGTLLEAIPIIKQGYKSTIAHMPIQAEGMVLTPAVQLFSRKGDRIITKLKHKDFRK